MKNTFVILLLLLLFSCRDYEKPVLPADQKSVDSQLFTCNINGKAFNGETIYAYLDTDSILTFKVTDQFGKQTLALKMPFFYQNTIMKFSTNNAVNHTFNYYQSFNLEPICVQIPLKTANSFAEISIDDVNELDKNQMSISGKFHFNVINVICKDTTKIMKDTVHITNGVFKNILIKSK